MLHVAKAVVIAAVLLVLFDQPGQASADGNRFVPHFLRKVYEFDVKEQVQPYRPVKIGHVTATDSDSTPPNNRMTFSIIQGLPADNHTMITIGALSGVFYGFNLKQARLELTIMVQDGGTPPLNSTASVKINVADANEPPECKPMNTPVSLTTRDGTTKSLKGMKFQTLKCADRDLQRDYKVNYYQLKGVSGFNSTALEANKYFSVNADTGEIQIGDPLPANRYSYLIHLRVGDNSNDPRYVDKTVNLVIKGLTPTCTTGRITMSEEASCCILTPCTSPYKDYIRYTAVSSQNSNWDKDMFTFTDLFGALEICKTKGMQADRVFIPIEANIPNWTPPSNPGNVVLSLTMSTSPVVIPTFGSDTYQASTEDDKAVGSIVFQYIDVTGMLSKPSLIMEPNCNFFSVSPSSNSTHAAIMVSRAIQGLPLDKTGCEGFLWGKTKDGVSARANLTINIIDTNSAPVCDSIQTVHLLYKSSTSTEMTPVVGLQCKDTDFTTNNAQIFYDLVPVLDYRSFILNDSKLFLKPWKDLRLDRATYSAIYRAKNSLSASPITSTATLSVRVTGLPLGCPKQTTELLSDQQPCTTTFLPCSGASSYSLFQDSRQKRELPSKLLNFSNSWEGIKICVVQNTKQNFTETMPLEALMLENHVRFTVNVRYTYKEPPEFSKDSYRALVYADSADKGNIVTTVSARAGDGSQVQYSCFCNGNSFWVIDARTGVITLRRKIPTEKLPRTEKIAVTASDTTGRNSSVPVVITIFARNDPPDNCTVKRYQTGIMDIPGLANSQPLATITCPSIGNVEAMQYEVQIQPLNGVSFPEQYLSFNKSSSVNSSSMTAGQPLSLYLKPGFPQKRANYTSRLVVTSPRGAGAQGPRGREYMIAYSMSVHIPPLIPIQQHVTEDTITVYWSWGEYGKAASAMFIKQTRMIQVTWMERSDSVSMMRPQSRNLTNTANGTTLSSLKTNTYYAINLAVYNTDPYYKPVVSEPFFITTANPYLYEVLLVDYRAFTMDLLDKTSNNYQKMLKEFRPGELQQGMREFQSQLKGFISLKFKYFQAGSVVAAVNIALNRNDKQSNSSLYSPNLRGVAGIKRITEQGKGSVRVMSVNIRQKVQLEGRPSEVNCSAEVFGPETPVFRWYLGSAGVLNISTTRVYFSKYWQNQYGYYVSTLFFKEIIPRDSGNITCAVELAPLSPTSRKIADKSVAQMVVLPKPVMLITPMKATVKKGGSVTIECSATYPTVDNIEKRPFGQIRWKKNNIVLEKNTSTEVIRYVTDQSAIPSKSSLSISSLEVATNLTCVGTNDAGSAEATTSIAVYSGSKLCKAETDSQGISWSDTAEGESDTQPCMKGYIGTADRKCIEKEKWGKPNLVHCVFNEMESIYIESMDLATGINKSTVEETSDRLRKLTAQVDNMLVSGNLLETVKIIENLVTAEEIGDSSTDLTEENIVESASNVLEMAYKAGWVDVQERYAGTSQLMKNLDRYGETVSGRHVAEKWRVVPSKNIVLQTKKTKITTAMASAQSTNKIVFPDPGLEGMVDWANDQTQISMDVKAVAGIYGDDEVALSGLQYKTLSVFLPESTSTEGSSSKSVNTDILALSIVPTKGAGGAVFDPPIQLRFQHINRNFSNATCNFWDFSANTTDEMRKNAGAWSTSGCKRIESDNDKTICECDHLTNFAILMSPSRVETHRALSYISWIGCGISIACLLATIIIYAIYWKHVKSDRSVILLNLCVSLILALTIFLAGVERRENKYVCTAVAALLHYFFLAVFCFMLVEGIELYILLVTVFDHGSSRKKWYILGGWGVPAIVVAISLGATQARGYGNENYCWLSIDNGLLWAFVAPALAIILINCVFLGLAMKAMFSTHAMEAKSSINKAKQGVRGLCILLPLLGTTWIFGVLAVNEDTIAFQYVFTILNSFQGLFIFIFHSLMNKRLLKQWKEKRASKSSSGSSSGAKPMTPYTPKKKRFSDRFNKSASKQGAKAKPRKASLPTEEMQFDYSSSTSAFQPEPELGTMGNPAFELDTPSPRAQEQVSSPAFHDDYQAGEPVSVDRIECSVP